MKQKHLWHSLDIPEGEVEGWEVKHRLREAGTTLNLATPRTVFLQGERPRTVTFDYPTRWHELREKGSLWMTDDPMEQYQHDALLKGFSGRVLVGGLGLGYAVTVLARKPRVKHIDVVELSGAVIRLVWEYTAHRGKAHVIHADLFDFLRQTDQTYDYAFYDIWQGDNEDTFFHTVLPLRQLSEGRVGRVVCWQETCMRGQLLMNLYTRMLFWPKNSDTLLAGGDVWTDWSVPFFQWFARRRPKQGAASNAAQAYSAIYGLPDWEARWQCHTQTL